MRRKTLSIVSGLVLAAGLGALLVPALHERWVVQRLVDRNVEARGGEDAWRNVEALRYTGTAEIGLGLEVPFVLDQQHPDRMCFEYEFDGGQVEQCSDGERGWKRVPFLGTAEVQPMTESELMDFADAADPWGLLFDFRARGHRIDLLPDQGVGDEVAHVLEVTLPGGSVREVWLDAETGLELKVVSTRMLAKKERRVETEYGDWTTTHGLTIPRRQVTRTEGDDQAHTLTVETLQVNPRMKVTRFLPPASLRAGSGEG